jgi:hypothetical protein
MNYTWHSDARPFPIVRFSHSSRSQRYNPKRERRRNSKSKSTHGLNGRVVWIKSSIRNTQMPMTLTIAIVKTCKNENRGVHYGPQGLFGSSASNRRRHRIIKRNTSSAATSLWPTMGRSCKQSRLSAIQSLPICVLSSELLRQRVLQEQ